MNKSQHVLSLQATASLIACAHMITTQAGGWKVRKRATLHTYLSQRYVKKQFLITTPIQYHSLATTHTLEVYEAL